MTAGIGSKALVALLLVLLLPRSTSNQGMLDQAALSVSPADPRRTGGYELAATLFEHHVRSILDASNWAGTAGIVVESARDSAFPALREPEMPRGAGAREDRNRRDGRAALFRTHVARPPLTGVQLIDRLRRESRSSTSSNVGLRHRPRQSCPEAEPLAA